MFGFIFSKIVQKTGQSKNIAYPILLDHFLFNIGCLGCIIWGLVVGFLKPQIFYGLPGSRMTINAASSNIPELVIGKTSS